jgi:succinyl-CoA synthetase beta subunit
MEKLLLGMEAFDLLTMEGVPVLKTLPAKDENEAVQVASEIGFPVALKISSPDVIHKTETGGIRVDLKDGSEVRNAFKEIVSTFTSANPGMRTDGVIVQSQGKGLELIIGTLKDQQFGPVLMCGLGGVYVEAIKDVSFRLIPLGAHDAKEMLEDLQGYGVLTCTRRERIDLSAIENFLLQISRLMEKHPEIEEMDLNPVFASSFGVEVCDARIKKGAELW